MAIKIFKLHNKTANGKAKNYQGRFLERDGELFPRDPSFPLEWLRENAQGRFKKVNASEVKP